MKKHLIILLFLLGSLLAKAQFFTDLTDWIAPLQTQFQEDQFFENWSQGKQDSVEYYLYILILSEPENQLYHYWLGRVYTKTLSMEMPTSLDPIMFDLTYFDKAKAVYTNLATWNPSDYLSYYAIGKLYLEKAILPLKMWGNVHADTKESIELYRKASGFVKREMAKALPYFKKAEKLNPNHIPTLIQISELYARLDDFEMVKRLIKRIEAIGNGEFFESSVFD